MAYAVDWCGTCVETFCPLIYCGVGYLTHVVGGIDYAEMYSDVWGREAFGRSLLPGEMIPKEHGWFRIFLSTQNYLSMISNDQDLLPYCLQELQVSNPKYRNPGEGNNLAPLHFEVTAVSPTVFTLRLGLCSRGII